MSFHAFSLSSKLLQFLVLSIFALAPSALNAETDNEQLQQLKVQVDELRTMVTGLQSRVTNLEQHNSELQLARRSGPDDAAALHTAWPVEIITDGERCYRSLARFWRRCAQAILHHSQGWQQAAWNGLRNL